MPSAEHRSRNLRAGVIGAVIGILIAVIAVLVVDRIVAGAQNDNFWLPAGIIIGLIAGGVIGMLFSQVIASGREGELATATAMKAVAAEDERRRQEDAS